MEAAVDWFTNLLSSGDSDALVFALCMGVVLVAPLTGRPLTHPWLGGFIGCGHVAWAKRL